MKGFGLAFIAPFIDPSSTTTTTQSAPSHLRVMSEQKDKQEMNPDAAAGETMVPRIDSVERVASTKWLALDSYSYTSEDGKPRKWDVCNRTTSSKDCADAVCIIPLLRKKDDPTTVETLLVKQFRPPVERYTLEFPAGLIDKDETPQEAALRELREETGYVGEFCSTPPQVSPEVCMSPGLTSESIHVVLVEVDLDNPYNQGTPKTALEEGEFVEVLRLPLKEGLKKVLDEKSTSEAMPIMGLYLFSMGLELGKQIQTQT